MEGKGELYVVSGPMFSGKTTTLIKNLQEYDEFEALKPDLDNRYSETEIASHTGLKVEARAIPVDRIDDTVRDADLENCGALGIDEAQFFGEGIIDAVKYACGKGLDVYVAGLDKDFRGEGFGRVPELVRMSDSSEKLYAECVECGDKAGYTQRIIDGEPARYDSPTVVVGADELYEPRCGKHHEVRPPSDEKEELREPVPNFSGS